MASQRDQQHGPSSAASYSSLSSRYVPSPPANTPRVSTASLRAWHLFELDRSIIALRGGHDEAGSKGNTSSGLLGLPESIRERIWRLVLVHDRTVVVCGCTTCPRLREAYLPLTQICRSVRWETLSIFYSSNRFMIPIGHDTMKDAHDWLLSMDTTCRRQIRHIEVPSFDIPTTAIHMRSISGMELATNLHNRENMMWDGEEMMVYWPIFRAIIPEIDGQSSTSNLIESVGSSILVTGSENSHDVDFEVLVAPQRITIQRNVPVIRLTLTSGQEIEPPDLTMAEQLGSPGSTVTIVRNIPAMEQDYTQTGSRIVNERLRATRRSDRSWITYNR